MRSATLILFAKLPAAGRVKTRLIPALGEAGSADLAKAFLLDLTQRLARELDKEFECILCFDPLGAENDFRALLVDVPGVLSRFKFVPQSSGDLGERLANALTTVQKSHPAPHIFIGIDAPDLGVGQIHNAAEISNSGRACIIPANDGGYVLLALPDKATPKSFDRIEWSTRETANQQVQQLNRCGIETMRGDLWPDVDEPRDLPGLLSRLENSAAVAPRTLNFLHSAALA